MHSFIQTQEASQFLELSLQGSSSTKPSLSNTHEVFRQLKMLRRRHDVGKVTCSLRDSTIQQLQKQISHFGAVESKTLLARDFATSQVRQLETELRTALEKQQHAAIAESRYKHVVERMEVDLTALEKHRQVLAKQTNQLDLTLREAQLKTRRVKEKQAKAKDAYATLKTYVAQQLQERKHALALASKEAERVRAQQELARTRAQHAQDVTEAAAHQALNKTSRKPREGLRLHRLWHLVMHTKLRLLMEKFGPVQAAFSKIKSNSSQTDVTEVVEKYLSREQDLAALLRSVAAAKLRVDRYMQFNGELEEKINALKPELVQTPTLPANQVLKKQLEPVKAAYSHAVDWTVQIVQAFNTATG